MRDHVTGISLREVRKLIEEKPIDDSVLDAVDRLLDVAILLSPIVVGPPAVSLLALVEPKNALVKLARDALAKFAKPEPGDYLDQATRLAAANCLLTYTAYFDALQRRSPKLMKDVKLTEEDKKRIAEGHPDRRPVVDVTELTRRQHKLAGSLSVTSLADRVISVPHPVNEGAESSTRRLLYTDMSEHVLRVLSSYDAIWSQLRDVERDRIGHVVTKEVPALAESMYQAELAGLAVDFPQFLIWLVLTDQDTKDTLIRKIGADSRIQFELVGRTVDLGLKGLAEEMAGIRRMLAAMGSPVSDQPFAPDLGAVAEELHLRYLAQIHTPVIDDSYEPDHGPKLSYPTRDESYVPQAYRLASYDDTATHLERDDAWTGRPVGQNLGRFLLRYVESAYSALRPLLILGHPGSGKSLLTQVLAARLAYPAYTTVRVELRDADTKMDIQGQIEAQIRKDTGEEISWTRFARTLPSPPVVILDGYDELLQATGSVHADYLDQVRQFQEREADLRRPVRVIVTSRITLIDKVSIPRGTTIVRLEEFDEQRRDAWTAVWNDRNSGYFDETGVRPFRLPANPRVTELAGQPLLLLMLALYDSAANQLSSEPDIDQTRLYDELLTRFIRRELDKDAEGFRRLPTADQRERLTRELERLGVAAIGMFNRQALVIRRDQLDKDLHYFGAEQHRPEAGTRPLSQADLLFGSFFFIHQSRSRLAESPSDQAAGPAAFEFLHKTFGEFLTADFILRQVLLQTETVAQMAGLSGLADPLREHLEHLDKNWFGCLVHTPLHTQPNVLDLLREWGSHRLTAGPRSRSDLLAAFDTILYAQLRGLLTAATLPVLATQDRNAPYESLPALGHLAIYSLNLILLRTYLSGHPYVLNEADLGAHPGICRPWDRLTAIWRSWFPPESLAAMASRFTATRQDNRISIEPAISSLAATTGTALAAAYNVGLAFADNLTAASLGLQLISLESMPEDSLDDLRERVHAEAPDLLRAIDIAISRTSHRPPSELPVCDSRANDESGGRYLDPGKDLEFAEVAERLILSPLKQRVIGLGGMSEFARLSRYAAEVAVSCHISSDMYWLPVLFDTTRENFRALLKGPAGAPVLRAALQQTDGDSWGARAIDEALAGDTDSLFDIDTAAAVALIAWRSSRTSLCTRTLDSIIRACEQRTWSVLDIPAQLWNDLANLLVSADPEIERRRQPFAKLIRARLDITNLDDLADYFWTPGTAGLAIHALRIDKNISHDTQKNIVAKMISTFGRFSNWSRRWFVLLIRFARENDSRWLVEYMFPQESTVDGESADSRWRNIFGVPPDKTLETLDIEDISAGLTYHEAMDLSWALAMARQAGKERDATARPHR